MSDALFDKEFLKKLEYLDLIARPLQIGFPVVAPLAAETIVVLSRAQNATSRPT